jgi:hypothetical protein
MFGDKVLRLQCVGGIWVRLVICGVGAGPVVPWVAD